MQSRVLVRPIHTVWIAVAQPPLRNALASSPRLVLLARKLSLIVALPVIALMPIVLVAVVQAIIVSVADIDPGNTISVVAREQVAEAGPSLRLAVLWRLVGSIAAIIVSVTVPSGRNATVIWTPETVLRTRPLSTMQLVFVGIVATVIVSVAQPVRLHANVGLLALEVIRRTGGVGRTSLVRLIGGSLVLAVIHSIADL